MMKPIAALGLDIGRKRIGVAGCDGLGLIAVGLTTIERRSYDQVINQLQQLIDERNVTVLVIGLPYTMDGTLGAQARQIQKFSRRLAATVNLPINYVDERFTSLQAKELMQAANQSPSRHKAIIDRKAAAIILQRWLDEQRNNS